MKNVLQNTILLALTFLLLSCNKDEEPTYATKFHNYFWDIDSTSLIISSSAFDRTIQLKDTDGCIAGIIGVTGMSAISQQDTVIIYNTGLDNNLINSIVLDTIRGDWFTVINEKEKGARIILDENEGTETRRLTMAVWVRPLENYSSKHDDFPIGDNLRIHQQPSKNK